jgi:hypothetical protein
VSRFLEEAIARSGLLPVLAAKRVNDLDTVRANVKALEAADLLALGAVADLVRAEELGEVVRLHHEHDVSPKVVWVDVPAGTSELDVLRMTAITRIASAKGTRVGFDWSRFGLELAQVALGFGVTDLRGSITRKNGLPIYEDEVQKVKGEGMVSLESLKKRELAKLVSHAGRCAVFVEDEGRVTIGQTFDSEATHA